MLCMKRVHMQFGNTNYYYNIIATHLHDNIILCVLSIVFTYYVRGGA